MEQYTGWQQQHQQQHASAPPPPDAVGHSEFLQAVQRLVCGLPDSPAASVAAVQLCAKQLKLFRCEQLLRSSPSVLRSRSQAATGSAAPPDDAFELLRRQSWRLFSNSISCDLLYRAHNARPRSVLSTGSEAIDALLTPDYNERRQRPIGFHCGSVTQLVGESASGKSQLCLSAATLPSNLSECSVALVHTAAHSDVRHIAHLIEQRLAQQQQQHIKMSPRQLMQRLKLFRAFSAVNLLDILERIENDLLQEVLDSLTTFSADLGLLIVDSPADVLSPLSADTGRQLRHDIGNTLRRLAVQHSLAVVVTNRLVRGPAGDWQAALGEGWTHVPDATLLLHRDAATAGRLFIAERLAQHDLDVRAPVLFEISSDRGVVHVPDNDRDAAANIANLE